MPICAFCNKDIEIADKVYRKDQCPHCLEDLHCCLQCRFYEPGRENDCREPRAERVVDNVKANFCDYFEFSGGDHLSTEQEDAKQKLENLFKI